MILLPIGHEETGVRRLPWVTFAIMGICLLAFIASGRAGLLSDDDVRLSQDANDAIEYYFSHPYLELDPRFEELAVPNGTDEQWTLRVAQAARALDPQLARGAARVVLSRAEPGSADFDQAQRLLTL